MATKMSGWRKGGMSCNGLRESGIVYDYFRTPGRQTIMADTPSNAFDINSFSHTITSIGQLQSSQLKQVTSGSYGAGSLLSTNVQVTHPSGINDAHMGTMHQNEKRTQFVNYRSTDPALVQALKQNPLSIYATTQAQKRPIPAFFADVRPDNYDTYTTKPIVNISKASILSTINGSPQSNILGLAEQNPLMGITVGIPNEHPTFYGKAYGGGNDSSARSIAMGIYNDAWQTNYGAYTTPDSGQACKNKALHYFAPGYNIAQQVQDGKMIEEIGKYPHGMMPQSTTNLPWGPQKRTGNPWTQQGGVWQKSHRSSQPFIQYNYNSIERNPRTQITNDMLRAPYRAFNCDLYKDYSNSSSLVCSN